LSTTRRPDGHCDLLATLGWLASVVKADADLRDQWRTTGCGKAMVFDVSGTCRRLDDCRAEPDDSK
jgi:hypothetical protein